MAFSSCPKCDNRFFELSEAEPAGAAYKVQFVQCASCGAVVGVLPYLNTASLIDRQNRAIKKIARALNVTVDL